MREGSLEAPTRHALDWQESGFLRHGARSRPRCTASSTSATPAGAASICAIRFPRLFDLVDNSPTGELDGVKPADYKQVVDACTLCDMCFMTKCPYVPPHELISTSRI